MDALPVLLDSPPAYIQNLDKHNDCYVTRVAYDLGSTDTQVRVALVNTCTNTIEKVISEHTYPIDFFEDVAESPQLRLSEWIQSLALQTLYMAKMQADMDIISAFTLIHPRIQHCAVATQAFRIAENGHEVVEKISTQTGIPFSVLAKEEEQKLVYLSVLSDWKAIHQQMPVVWDISSVNAQFIFQNEVGEFYSDYNKMATYGFQQWIQQKIRGNSSESSINPMSNSDIEFALKFATQEFRKKSSDNFMIATRIKNHAPVIGIGKVHNLCALPWVQKFSQKSQQGYSKDDLLTVLSGLCNKTDDEIQALAPSIPKEYIPNQITNIILIIAMMDTMGIDWVEVRNVNNTSGLLLTGCR